MHNMIIVNPFRYGKIVDEPYFIDRVNELKQIKNDLISCQNLIIYSPRRYGKTSLIIKVLKEFKKEKYYVIYIDFFKITSQRKFIEDYSKEILRNQTFFRKAISKFQSLVRGLTAFVSFNDKGEPSFSISFQTDVNLSDSLTDVLNLPLKLDKKKKWIIVFDEFQEIEKLNGENFEKLLRSVIQFHENISYVFMGSKTHLLLNMFSRQNRAFYKFGKLVKIKKIDKKEFKEYIINRFSEGEFDCMNNLADNIIQITNNIPYYVQFLASEVWNEGLNNNRKITEKQLDNAFENILTNQQDYFLQLYEDLSSYQKKVLLALARSREQIFSEEFQRTHNLGPVSSTQRAIEKLEKTGIIEKNEGNIEFSDPFFPSFLRLRGFA